ncbi:MAG: ATP-binding protein [Thermoprotei archaeon]|jgi:predicted AAA+ superfamily ATPase
MNREKIIKYIEDWYNKKLPELVERELKIDLIKDKIICIVGPRRAGKTYFFFQLIKNINANSLYLDFEDVALLDVKYDEILDIINLYHEVTGKELNNVFLDEIQNIENWESAVRTLLDRTNLNVFVTGSSSKLLSREIATQLRGRSLSYLLLPFSFREFLEAKNFELRKVLTDKDRAIIKNLLKEYLDYGGFPEVVLSENKEKILREYYNTILFRDFVERFNLKSISVAKFLFEFIFQNIANEISINKIVNYFKAQKIPFGKNTIYDYVDKLQDTLIFFFIERYTKSVYKRKAFPKKIYITDLGLNKVIRFSEDLGKRMENIVYLELLRKTNYNPIQEIFYFRDRKREIDFVIKQGPEVKQLINVTYASAKNEIAKREINSLIETSDLLNCKDLLLITWDYEDEIKINNKRIKIIPLWKWLIT